MDEVTVGTSIFVQSTTDDYNRFPLTSGLHGAYFIIMHDLQREAVNDSVIVHRK